MGHTGSILDERESLIKYCEDLYRELFNHEHYYGNYSMEELREVAYKLEETASGSQYTQDR